MGILLGLASAISWGLADFLARFAARQVGHFRALFWMQFVGLFGFGFWLLLTDGPTTFDWGLLALTVLLALSNTLADLSLYRAFEIGTLSVVSPIASSYAAPIVLLSLLFGRFPSWFALLGFIVTLVGVGLASAPLDFTVARSWQVGRGVGLALIACGGFGFAFWGLGWVTPGLGAVLPAWEIRIISLLTLPFLARLLGHSISLPTRSAWLWIGGVGLFDGVAFLCYNFGTRTADTTLVAVLSSLFSAVTVGLAWLFLHEKLAFNQWLGIVLILGGVCLLSFPDQ